MASSEDVSAPAPVPEDENEDKRTPEEKEEAEIGAAVAKVGIFALILGLFFNILRMLRGNRNKPKSS